MGDSLYGLRIWWGQQWVDSLSHGARNKKKQKNENKNETLEKEMPAPLLHCFHFRGVGWVGGGFMTWVKDLMGSTRGGFLISWGEKWKNTEKRK